MSSWGVLFVIRPGPTRLWTGSLRLFPVTRFLCETRLEPARGLCGWPSFHVLSSHVLVHQVQISTHYAHYTLKE